MLCTKEKNSEGDFMMTLSKKMKIASTGESSVKRMSSNMTRAVAQVLSKENLKNAKMLIKRFLENILTVKPRGAYCNN
jgi:tartrate dehydratase alpha subunit/fumarate hydratase class I-like protein